jgi:crotonobetainyl-CoA:carnitine CoA-transferase CaiB-like acyl-CoA transferase
MFRWLGEPADLADPALTSIVARYKAVDRIYPAIRQLFATRTREEIVTESRTYGVPAAGLLDAGEVMDADHFTARHAFTSFPGTAGASARLANGMVELDGTRAGLRTPAPGAGQHTDEVLKEVAENSIGSKASATDVRRMQTPRRPLGGIRVLDLGVIVVGAETGRLMADMGAEVIKVENRAFPDGSRQSGRAESMSVTFAWGHRNKLGLGLNLRDERGAELFRRLAASCDVVLSNFKPGTLDSLGLSYEALAATNPGIVVAESSAFGPTGPWSRRMGYGPLVRAETGVTAQWRYPDMADGYSDASTIYPDHVAARVIATSVLARLIERRSTGRGGSVSVAQAEVILSQYASALAAESVEPGSFSRAIDPIAGDAPRGTYPCAGDDEWVTVTVRGDKDWRALAPFLGASELLDDARFADATARAAHRVVLDGLLSEWTLKRTPREAMTQLQSAGVPAGMMQRVTDLSTDPHLCSRGFLRTMTHPLLRRPVLTENAPALFTHVADPDLRPAPMPGEHTRDVCNRWLGLSDDEIDALIAEGVLEEWLPEPDPESGNS